MDSGQVTEAVGMVRAGVSALLSADLTALDSRSVTELLIELECEHRRLAAVDTRVVCEAETRWVAGDYGQTGTGELLMQALRVSPREARARVKRAEELGPRRTAGGEPLPPLFEQAAAALSEGAISTEHADVISRQLTELDRIPDVDPGALEVAEKLLVDTARHEPPRVLAMIGTQLRDRLDPDGREPRDEEIKRRRGFVLHEHADGTSTPHGLLTATATAYLKASLDPLSAPAPAEDGTPDPRTPRQRGHDGLEELARRALASGDLPPAGGAPVTALVTVDWRDLLATLGDDPMQRPEGGGPVRCGRPRPGYGLTGHGSFVPLSVLLGDLCATEIATVVTNDTGGVLAFARSKRLATREQRLALVARDRGCCFPGCTRPPAWCEAHHLKPWQDGGPTDLGNLCLLCRFHHREFDRRGWQVNMIDGHPEWIPPPWIDPAQRPRRNTAHHPPDFDLVR